MKHVIVAFGTRPEAIKMAPAVFALRRTPGIACTVLLTGQHREQLDSALAVFGIRGDIDLDVMLAGQPLAVLAARVMEGSARVLREQQPDYVLVHGDTVSASSVAQAAFLERIPVGHVEAGFRSGVIDEPFPEESSRRIIDILSDLDFAPTALARANLIREGKDPERILLTGQTTVDAIRMAAGREQVPDAWGHAPFVTVTMHRRESWPVLGSMAGAIAGAARRHPDHTFVFPMHLNPIVRDAVIPPLADLPNVRLVEPLDYGQMAALMAASRLILTDSGGLQEEGASLGVHVAILRNITEKPEGLELGIATLVGNDPARIGAAIDDLLERLPAERVAPDESPYGDGRAGERVAEGVAWRLGIGDQPAPWVPRATG